MPLPDPEQLAFIEQQPTSLTFTELAALCRQHFGIPRAWSIETIRRCWHRQHPKGVAAGRSWIARDPEVCAFIRDRSGRLTLDQLRIEIGRRFSASRVPSRSALHRFIHAESSTSSR